MEDKFPCLSHLHRKLDLFTYWDPRSAHTRIWPSSHSEVQAEEKTNLSSLCVEFNMTIQRKPVHCRATGQVSKTFQRVSPSTPAILSPLQSLLLVNNRACRKLKESGFGWTGSSPVAKNVKCFPRKFLLLQESRVGNQENFDTFQTVGVRKTKAVKVLMGLLLKNCEQNGGSWTSFSLKTTIESLAVLKSDLVLKIVFPRYEILYNIIYIKKHA